MKLKNDYSIPIIQLNFQIKKWRKRIGRNCVTIFKKYKNGKKIPNKNRIYWTEELGEKAIMNPNQYFNGTS